MLLYNIEVILSKIKIIFSCLIFLFVGVFFIPFFSYSETEIEVQENEINVSTNPENPEPYQNTTISLSSYATDLNKAIITWKKNGETVLYGIGKTTYSFTVLGPDTASSFSVSIKPAGSINTIIKNITVVPSEVELLWESIDGYAPPFYKGKVLSTDGSKIRVVAVPNTSTIKTGKGSIVYTWKQGDSTKPEFSGYNKDSYVFKKSMFEDENRIMVNSSSVSGDYVATKTTQIPTYKPKIVYYKKSPAEGVLYNNALNKETTMTEEEMTIVAEPYFVSLLDNENNLSYEWKINNKTIPTPSKKTELTIKPTSRGGYATINTIIENTNDLFQKVSNQLKINL
jgi:hypothetical protein